MKWLVFVPALLAAIVLGLWLRKRDRWTPLFWTVVGFLPFVQPAVGPFKLALIGLPEFPGYTHGIEVTLLDLMVLALYIAAPRNRNPLPLRFTRFLYFGAITLSVAQADHTFAAAFVVWQLLRMNFLFGVVVRAAQDSRIPGAILRGMALGVVATGVLGVVQRYFLGYHEVPGFFSHQNLIGLTCYFAIMPAFALLLAQPVTLLTAATVAAGGVAVILSLSRGGLILTGFGLALIMAFSMLRRYSHRKLAVALITLLGAGVLLAKSFEQIQVRFATRSYGAFEGEDERARLETAASLMLDEHPFGVGANHFTTVLLHQGYFERARLFRHAGSVTIVVHNVYWLTAVEAGYLGLVSFGMLLAAAAFLAFRNGLRNRGDIRGDVLFALGVAILLFAFHGLLEWIHVIRDLQYVFWLALGIVGGLSLQLRRTPAAM
jgi:O-antigen ligase